MLKNEGIRVWERQEWGCEGSQGQGKGGLGSGTPGMRQRKNFKGPWGWKMKGLGSGEGRNGHPEGPGAKEKATPGGWDG